MIPRPLHDEGQVVPVVLGAPQSAARGEDLAEILGQPLVDPEQARPHRLLEVGGRDVGGAAVLPVPGMDELMGQKRGVGLALLLVEERALGTRSSLAS